MKLTKERVAGTRKRVRGGSGFIEDLVRTEEGVVSPRIFVDPEIYSRELERIYARSWLFVAHESEIPEAGDFVTRYMGEDPVIVWRGQDGTVRVFLNVCRHRGRKDPGTTRPNCTSNPAAIPDGFGGNSSQGLAGVGSCLFLILTFRA